MARKKKAETVAAEPAPKKSTGKIVHIIPPKAPPVRVVEHDPTKFEVAPGPKFPVKLHTIRPAASEAGSTRDEPTWERGATVLSQGKTLMGLNWYNYVMDDKHYPKVLEQFVRATVAAPDSDKLMKRLSRVPDKQLNGTKIALMRMYLRGFPLSKYHYKWVRQWLMELASGVKKEAPKTDDEGKVVEEKKGPSIQDRIRNQIRPALAELDAMSDALLSSEPYDGNAQELLHNTEFKAPQFRMIADYLETNMKEWNKALAVKKLKEIEEDSEEADLAEGYRLTTTKQLKKAVDAFGELYAEVKGTIEAVKPARKKRSRNLDKVVAKMKFKAADTELGIESVDPKDVMGANVVYLYNTKRRKLIQLVGEFPTSIDVKRSTIIGVNMSASATKTLRKPEEQLKEFNALRKGSTQKWFDKLKCKPRPAKNRLNIDTIILRAD